MHTKFDCLIDWLLIDWLVDVKQAPIHKKCIHSCITRLKSGHNFTSRQIMLYLLKRLLLEFRIGVISDFQFNFVVVIVNAVKSQEVICFTKKDLKYESISLQFTYTFPLLCCHYQMPRRWKSWWFTFKVNYKLSSEYESSERSMEIDEKIIYWLLAFVVLCVWRFGGMK